MRKTKGHFGEEIARLYLIDKGYTILHTNWATVGGEIDIIAENQEALIFVEVKYRTSEKYGAGHDSINFYKKKALYRTIKKFLHVNDLPNNYWQFDVITIVRVRKRLHLMHYPRVSLRFHSTCF